MSALRIPAVSAPHLPPLAELGLPGRRVPAPLQRARRHRPRAHPHLGITQKSAWFLAHRIRRAFEDAGDGEPFAGPVEVDEAYFGGLENNKHEGRKLRVGRGGVGKTAVVAVRDRAPNKVLAAVVPDVSRPTLSDFVGAAAAPDARIYSDEARAYLGLPNHAAVNHGDGNYVDGEAYVQGVESFWSTMKRAHKGTYHLMSPKHLQHYVDEFAGRHNLDGDTEIERMGAVVGALEGKLVTYRELTR